jgi:hypothetical protein
MEAGNAEAEEGKAPAVTASIDARRNVVTRQDHPSAPRASVVAAGWRLAGARSGGGIDPA